MKWKELFFLKIIKEYGTNVKFVNQCNDNLCLLSVGKEKYLMDNADFDQAIAFRWQLTISKTPAAR